MNIIHPFVKKDSINVLTFPTHERMSSLLAYTDANWMLYQNTNVKPWNFKYNPLPRNHTLLPYQQLPPLTFDPDVILCQNKAAHYNHMVNLVNKYHVPTIHLEHCVRHPGIKKEHLIQWQNARTDISLFISDFTRRDWGYNDTNSNVIYHGIDTDIFKPKDIEKNIRVLSVVNDLVNRDVFCGFNLWKTITEFPNKPFPYELVGDNPGISDAASSVEELINMYSSAGIFLNTSLLSSYPTVLLEAAACGCAIVSTRNCGIPEIFDDSNALLSNDPSKLKSWCIQLLKDKDMREEYGRRSRQNIVERFGIQKFIESWSKIFDLL